LKPKGQGLTVVGDDAQSIYSFRAATVRNIVEFPKSFTPPAEVVTLDRNYRSTEPILAAANAVISLAAERYAKNVWTERHSSERPQLVTVRDESDQARFIAERVLEVRESGMTLKQQAALSRASHHSAMLELELARRNIPFMKFGGLKFLDSAHVKDLLALLRFAQNPRDRVAGFRILQILPGVGPSSAQKILDFLIERPDPLACLAEAPTPPRAGEEWRGLGATLQILNAREGWPAEMEAARRWYEPHLERLQEDAPSRLADLVQLEQIAACYPLRERFLTELTLDPPDATSDEAGPPLRDEDYLILSTIHSAKGQEWKSVFVQRRRRLHPLRSRDGNGGGDRGGAPAALCRDDAREGQPAPGDAAAIFHLWPASAGRPACLRRAHALHSGGCAAVFRMRELAGLGSGGRASRRRWAAGRCAGEDAGDVGGIDEGDVAVGEVRQGLTARRESVRAFEIAAFDSKRPL
jgi:superfamily I DNA/RNA helicase